MTETNRLSMPAIAFIYGAAPAYIKLHCKGIREDHQTPFLLSDLIEYAWLLIDTIEAEKIIRKGAPVYLGMSLPTLSRDLAVFEILDCYDQESDNCAYELWRQKLFDIVTHLEAISFELTNSLALPVCNTVVKLGTFISAPLFSAYDGAPNDTAWSDLANNIKTLQEELEEKGWFPDILKEFLIEVESTQSNVETEFTTLYKEHSLKNILFTGQLQCLFNKTLEQLNGKAIIAGPRCTNMELLPPEFTDDYLGLHVCKSIKWMRFQPAGKDHVSIDMANLQDQLQLISILVKQRGIPITRASLVERIGKRGPLITSRKEAINLLFNEKGIPLVIPDGRNASGYVLEKQETNPVNSAPKRLT
jgi:hypothetical protein